MPGKIINSLLFALFAGIGAALGCAVMGVYQEPVKFLQFFAIEFPIAFVFHILLTLLSERLKRKKQPRTSSI